MTLNKFCLVQIKTVTQNEVLMQVENFVSLKRLHCDIQPLSLSEATKLSSGPSPLPYDSKKLFCYKDESLVFGMRIVDDSNQSDVKTYEIRAINHWRIHTELILSPIQGGQE